MPFAEAARQMAVAYRHLLEPLRARMQGKACFNFKAVDETLFGELDRLTGDGLKAFEAAGYLSRAGKPDK